VRGQAVDAVHEAGVQVEGEVLGDQSWGSMLGFCKIYSQKIEDKIDDCAKNIDIHAQINDRSI
jgi:hypothetical protein